jgi:type I restriction enzyme R subunit
MNPAPLLQEEHISQVPALQLLQNLGYTYLRPQEVFLERRGKLANVILEGVIEKQLRKLNRVKFKGREHAFSDASIQGAIQAARDIPIDGLIRTNEQVYDLLSLGKSFEETIQGETKSFTIDYVDWVRPENNAFHVTEEFEVERTASYKICRPDIVLFINGIPFCVIECKRTDEKDPLKQAISQQIRNEQADYIPRLFIYSQLLLVVNKNQALYATTGSTPEFWSGWREDVGEEIDRLVNRPLSAEQKQRLFADRFAYVRRFFDDLDLEGRIPTAQDRAIYSLCRPERLIDLARRFVLFDAAEKKIARYQQYFAVKETMARIKALGPDGVRQGGVIWHTQGSGKSLTMVMLAKSIALEPAIPDSKIVVVTDRVDLDDQIRDTFKHCGKDTTQAKTGRHLMESIAARKETVITTVIDKFQSGIKGKDFKDTSNNVFVLVDESHRTQYGISHGKMRKVLPNACYIGFTGTPLMKGEKNTARRFGGLIHTYTIDRAVKDKAVVPLLYEGRHVLQDVDQKAIDQWFEIITKPLTTAERADLKRKFASADQLNKAHGKIYMTAYDVSEHFRRNLKGTRFKAQLTADRKASALKFKEYLDEFGQVTSEVLISAPDVREGNDDIYDPSKDEVQAFWRRTLERYGSEKEYNKSVIAKFKDAEEPEIVIVVDKLLTGFDAPRNTVLYLARSLKEHTLLQAIARVNRLFEGKEFGFIIDYYGVLQELGDALDLYTSLPDFDKEDLRDCMAGIMEQVRTLPQKHSELCDVFKTVRGKRDEEAYEQFLADEAERQRFYEKLSVYSRTLGIALSTIKFISDTPDNMLARYKGDLSFFQKLRYSVKRRYSEEVDYSEYETRIQKLIDTHVGSNEILRITRQVNIFEQDKFKAELDRLKSDAARADTIAHRTKKTISERMEEDPFFYRRFSKILEDVIEDYRQRRITDAEYLNRVTYIINSIVNRIGDDLPAELNNRDAAKAFYGVVYEAVSPRLDLSDDARQAALRAALRIDEIILDNRVVDWVRNADAQNEMRNQIDDCLYALKEELNIDLGFDAMDSVIESAISVAKARYE